MQELSGGSPSGDGQPPRRIEGGPDHGYADERDVKPWERRGPPPSDVAPWQQRNRDDRPRGPRADDYGYRGQGTAPPWAAGGQSNNHHGYSRGGDYHGRGGDYHGHGHNHGHGPRGGNYSTSSGAAPWHQASAPAAPSGGHAGYGYSGYSSYPSGMGAPGAPPGMGVPPPPPGMSSMYYGAGSPPPPPPGEASPPPVCVLST